MPGVQAPVPREDFLDPIRGPLFTVPLRRGAAADRWSASPGSRYYYLGVRVDPTVLPAPEPGKPDVHGRPRRLELLIGFGLIMLGLVVAAHPRTPLGRGRGVVVGMLGCFLIGLLWICTLLRVHRRRPRQVPVFNDLGQYNLLVGIGFMAVGFTYATRWE